MLVSATRPLVVKLILLAPFLAQLLINCLIVRAQAKFLRLANTPGDTTPILLPVRFACVAHAAVVMVAGVLLILGKD